MVSASFTPPARRKVKVSLSSSPMVRIMWLPISFTSMACSGSGPTQRAEPAVARIGWTISKVSRWPEHMIASSPLRGLGATEEGSREEALPPRGVGIAKRARQGWRDRLHGHVHCARRHRLNEAGRSERDILHRLVVEDQGDHHANLTEVVQVLCREPALRQKALQRLGPARPANDAATGAENMLSNCPADAAQTHDAYPISSNLHTPLHPGLVLSSLKSDVSGHIPTLLPPDFAVLLRAGVRNVRSAGVPFAGVSLSFEHVGRQLLCRVMRVQHRREICFSANRFGGCSRLGIIQRGSIFRTTY